MKKFIIGSLFALAFVFPPNVKLFFNCVHANLPSALSVSQGQAIVAACKAAYPLPSPF